MRLILVSGSLTRNLFILMCLAIARNTTHWSSEL